MNKLYIYELNGLMSIKISLEMIIYWQNGVFRYSKKPYNACCKIIEANTYTYSVTNGYT